ncbi:hypothetical protein FHS96_001873 [Sphingomonas zeicaulis]|uniref:DUF1801 domain-containing protein n=1 Tax=Sphingomonas zeicaulis TaxID=1632740 RepID=UPI003D1E42A5
MAEIKTQASAASVDTFLAAVPDPRRRTDAESLRALLEQVTGCAAKMWGPAIIGFGSYHYCYDSGHEGDMAMIGFSPRKANLVLYFARDFEGADALVAGLGKLKAGKGCLYVNRLSDLDADRLADFARQSVAHMRATYPTTD